MTLEFLLRMRTARAADAAPDARHDARSDGGGGIYDQLGGGFARYSTDATWLVPHFEKMLYDNAQLAQLYTRAWHVTGEDRIGASRPRRSSTCSVRCGIPKADFFSSQDADSEGVEGKFFTWSWDELVGLVGEEAAKALGAEPGGTGPEKMTEGTNVLWRPDGVGAPREEDLDGGQSGSCSRSERDACGRRPTTRC